MRSVWKGSVNFGMVVIPANLYSASESRRVSGIHQYHTCGSRIQEPKWCPVCDGKVEAGEIKRGYELSKESHIIFEEGEMESLPLSSLHSIEVVEFVYPESIDARCYDGSYFLTCEDTGAKAFALLLRGMERLGVVGVGKLGFREKEHLSVIRPYDGIMLLQTLHYSSELKSYDEFKPRQVALSDKEMELAENLVNAMIAEFDLGKYHNEYKEALTKLIEAKITGELIPVREVENIAPARDVADALIKSLEMMGVK